MRTPPLLPAALIQTPPAAQGATLSIVSPRASPSGTTLTCGAAPALAGVPTAASSTATRPEAHADRITRGPRTYDALTNRAYASENPAARAWP